MVTVPATCANLGCAFDCAAIALNVYLRAAAMPDELPGFRVRYSGIHSDRVPLDESNLVVRGIRSVARWAGAELKGARIQIESEIPVGVGLGSSAAAIISGILLGARLCGAQPDAATTLRLALELEGHPDNICAAYHGGLVVAAVAGEPQGILTCRTDVPTELDFIAVIPDRTLPTEQARRALPAHYTREDAVHNLQRAALLVASCFSGRFDLLPELFQDRLHQPHRARFVPGLEACLSFRDPDLLGIFLSGAGSAVMAVGRRRASEIGERLVEEFHRNGVEAQAVVLKAENRGAADSRGKQAGLVTKLPLPARRASKRTPK